MSEFNKILEGLQNVFNEAQAEDADMMKVGVLGVLLRQKGGVVQFPLTEIQSLTGGISIEIQKGIVTVTAVEESELPKEC